MYKIVKLKYKSIMVNEDDKHSVEIDTNGTIHMNGKETHFYFESKEKVAFDIGVKLNQLVLKQGNSVLNFEFNNGVENLYQTEYGALMFTSYLDVLEMKDDCLKIKYRLFQEETCISKVYMHIKWLTAS